MYHTPPRKLPQNRIAEYNQSYEINTALSIDALLLESFYSMLKPSSLSSELQQQLMWG